MEIWVPLLGKTTQVQFVAERDCDDFAGMEKSTYVCRCIYVAVSCGDVLIFFYFWYVIVFSNWLESILCF
jgi:hypothetical protein